MGAVSPEGFARRSESNLRVATAKLDITPPAGTKVVGHIREVDGVRDRLHAVVLLLDDGKTKAAMVTLDLVMPEYDGLHALRGIKAIDPHARVIVVSALEQKNILKEAFQLGANDFIVKPFDRQNLVETLEKAFAPVAT